VAFYERGFGARQMDAAMFATHHGFGLVLGASRVRWGFGKAAVFLVSGQHAGDHQDSNDQYDPKQYFSHISPVPE
jgi:hypothetical protein